MNLLARLKKAEDTINPPPEPASGPCAGLSKRMRECGGNPPSNKPPRPGSLAHRMQERAARRIANELA